MYLVSNIEYPVRGDVGELVWQRQQRGLQRRGLWLEPQ